MTPLKYIVALYLFIQITVASLQKRDYVSRQYYALNTENNEINQVKELTERLGATYEGRIGELPTYFLISFPAHHKKQLVKRDLKDYEIYPQMPSKRLFKRLPVDTSMDLGDWVLNATLPNINEYKGFHRIKSYLQINSPGFDSQWHHLNRQEIGSDLNVTGVWRQGITGKGITIAILDDGLDMDHNDLKPNYFPEGSYDFNDHVPEPRPRLIDDTHGTRCAGEIAAVKDGMCGVGVAYDAKVSGIRILSGDLTEADEAAAINYAFQKNDIYSCSWGPPDTGDVMQGPPKIIEDAFKNGVNNGRNGSGSIFVFASGNGGTNSDNCNFDGYTNSIYTLTVGAVDRYGNHPPYAESCAAQLMVAYSSGKTSYIHTTDVSNKCSDAHGGTSAAAPLAAGILALVLSVRPELSWRDLQHLCVQSAIPFSLDDPDWAILPSGRKFNHKFGYGVVDAYKIVEMAKSFKSVGEQVHLDIEQVKASNDPIPDITPTQVNGEINKDKGYTNTLMVTEQQMQGAQLLRVEHVTVTVNITHARRGDLEIYLESPNGVVSQLATPRKKDNSAEGLVNWTFMTVKHWEENPVGLWTLRVIDAENPEYTGTFLGWKMTLWGEKKPNNINESKMRSVNVLSANNTVKVNIKPDIEIENKENIGDLRAQMSPVVNKPSKKISISQNILDQLDTLEDKIETLKNKKEIFKGKKQKQDTQLDEEENSKAKVEISPDQQEKNTSLKDVQEIEIHGMSKEQIDEESTFILQHKIKDLMDQIDEGSNEIKPEIIDTNVSKLQNTGIKQLDSEINATNATLGEKSVYDSSSVSIVFFILLTITIACLVFIFKKYVTVSGKMTEYMNMASQNNYEVRQLLIQPNDNHN